jgi:hypothetical protein
MGGFRSVIHRHRRDDRLGDPSLKQTFGASPVPAILNHHRSWIADFLDGYGMAQAAPGSRFTYRG